LSSTVGAGSAGAICDPEGLSGFDRFDMPVESIDRRHRSTPDALFRIGTIRPAGGVVRTKDLLRAISIRDLPGRKLVIECIPELR
jgi:hypothetical protein